MRAQYVLTIVFRRVPACHGMFRLLSLGLDFGGRDSSWAPMSVVGVAGGLSCSGVSRRVLVAVSGKTYSPRPPNAALARKSDNPTSPNTAPATRSNTELLLH